MASDHTVELALPLPAGDAESVLVARAVAGDHDAYAALLRTHERIAYRVAAAITGWNGNARRRRRTPS